MFSKGNLGKIVYWWVYFLFNLYYIGIVNLILGENCLFLIWVILFNFFLYKMIVGIYESGKSKKEVYFVYNLYIFDSGFGVFM